MKTTNQTLLYLATASLLIITSCVPTDDENVDLDDTWGCTETSILFGNTSYEVNISTDASNSSIIYLENFYNLGFSNKATATVSGDNINISTQTIDGYQISGSGTVNSQNSLSFNYYSYDGSDRDTISATYTRK